MTIKIQDLIPGNELQCWMRLGLALMPSVKGDGTPYYIVPRKPHRARGDDLNRFIGWVVLNEPDLSVITLQVSLMNSAGASYKTSQFPRQADIAYSAFQKVRKFSAISFEPTPEVPGSMAGKGYKRPGSIVTLGSMTARRPYRTVEEVLL